MCLLETYQIWAQDDLVSIVSKLPFLDCREVTFNHNLYHSL